MFVWLNLAVVLEDEHQMSDVLVLNTIRYLPGVEHEASSPPASYHPVCNLHDPALGMEFLPVAGINHHVSPGTGHRRSPVSAATIASRPDAWTSEFPMHSTTSNRSPVAAGRSAHAQCNRGIASRSRRNRAAAVLTIASL